MATTIPSEVKNIVTFIFVKDAENKLVPNGTGFFVGIKDKKNTNRLYIYLVTAKHVLQDEKNENKYYPSVYIRLNTKAGDSRYIELPIVAQNRKVVYTHSEPEVDIAVIPCLPSAEIYDYKLLPEEMLTTKELFEKNHIKEGDEIFFTGLFIGHFGKQKNYPIVRFGRVAMLTDEKINWEGQDIDLYLVETQSFGGNSGSPVFFYLSPTREPNKLVIGPPKLLLAGIMKGSFLKGTPISIIETENIPVSFENIGIAAVVPAYKLHEILFSEELEAFRRPVEEMVDKKDGD